MKIKFIVFLFLLSQSKIALCQGTGCCEDWDGVLVDLITNGDFLLYDSTCLTQHASVQPCPDPIQLGCVNAWNASHGSPEFSMSDHAVVLGSVRSAGYVWGEGIYQNLHQPLDSGQTYILFLDYELKDDNDSSFLLIQLTNQEFHPGSCFEMSPIPGWEIQEHPLAALQQQQSTAIIFKTTETFDKIWFSNWTECNAVSWMMVSNIHLFQFDNLYSSHLIQILQSIHPGSDQQLQMILYENCYSGYRISSATTNPCAKDTSK